MAIHITGAPCSWGVDDPKNPHLPPWTTVLREAATAGYRGIELGPYGYLPLDVATVSAELDANARKVADEFANEIVGIFQNSFIRVEGNTDSTGNKKSNIELSKKRAEAVVDYLITRQRFDPARFAAVGNGPDRPIGDNKTDEGREWNRRTDFRVVPNY